MWSGTKLRYDEVFSQTPRSAGAWLSGQLADRIAAGWGGGCDARDGSGKQALVHVRLDGKTVRGAKDADGDQLHLLAALAGPAGDGGAAVVVAQGEVKGAETNEPAAARDVLGRLDLRGTVVTADALHTVKATAELICQRGGQFVFPVKENRQALFGALDRLAWNHNSDRAQQHRHRTWSDHPSHDPGPSAPEDLPFPHVNQVWLVERYVTDTAGRHISAVAQVGVASHTVSQASPPEVAGYVQGQWAIEVLHWLRDTCYREDNSTVRTRSGPRVLASLRNLAIGAYGWRDAATSLRPPGGLAAT